LIKDLNVRVETVKLLDENTNENFLDFGLNNNFFDMTPKAQVIKAKMNKGELHQTASSQQNLLLLRDYYQKYRNHTTPSPLQNPQII
jgi:hypothetical protein